MFRVFFNYLIIIIVASPILYYLFPNIESSLISLGFNKVTEPIFQSFIASIVFLFFVFALIKPSAEMSDYIANVPKPPLEDTGLKSHYRFKIMNHSIFRAYDLVIYIYKKERVSQSGNDIRRSLLAKIDGYEIGIPYLQSSLLSLFDKSRPHACQFRPSRFIKDSDFYNAISGDSSIEVLVTLRHGLSGLQGIFIKEFPNEDCIKDGYFKHGYQLGIRK